MTATPGGTIACPATEGGWSSLDRHAWAALLAPKPPRSRSVVPTKGPQREATGLLATTSRGSYRLGEWWSAPAKFPDELAA